MDMIQNFQGSPSEYHSDKDVTIKQTEDPALTPASEVENNIGSFVCNICFDSAQDPVVTLCGHLYCWACIFRWLHVQSSSSSSEQAHQRACPVCKSNISQASLIPLYCHGPSHTESNPNIPYCDPIPPRPTISGLRYSNPQLPSGPFASQSPLFDHQQYLSDPYSSYTSISSSSLVSTTMAGIINPTIGLLGELVHARMFGSADTGLLAYPIPSSYATVGRSNPRVRRQEMQLDKSLNRVSIFLFCCFILCLLLF